MQLFNVTATSLALTFTLWTYAASAMPLPIPNEPMNYHREAGEKDPEYLRRIQRQVDEEFKDCVNSRVRPYQHSHIFDTPLENPTLHTS